MNHTARTYKTMADLIGIFLSHHDEGQLSHIDTISIGNLAGIANILNGNAPLQQWKDIRSLADHAIEILEAENPELFGVGATTETCKPAKSSDFRANSDALYPAELTAIRVVGKLLHGITLKKLSMEDQQLIKLSITQWEAFNFGMFNRLMILTENL